MSRGGVPLRFLDHRRRYCVQQVGSWHDLATKESSECPFLNLKSATENVVVILFNLYCFSVNKYPEILSFKSLKLR